MKKIYLFALAIVLCAGFSVQAAHARPPGFIFEVKGTVTENGVPVDDAMLVLIATAILQMSILAAMDVLCTSGKLLGRTACKSVYPC